MVKQTLLQKALESHNKNRKAKSVSDEQYELCIAYAKGNVSFNTMVETLSLSNNNSLYPIVVASFKRYVKENPIKD